MAVEARRGCGYRKVGGLYMCSDGAGVPCCKMPIILHICPTCNQGIKQTRGWQWINPGPWLTGPCTERRTVCPAVDASVLGERVGLLWIGAKFYPTPGDFAEEAHRMGISRRIKVIPRGFKVGETYVFFAHPKVKQVVDDATGEQVWHGGVFRIFRPTRIEKLITETMSKNSDIMAELEDRGITPVIVPDNDKDHRGTVYDDDEDELPFAPGAEPDQPEKRP